MQNHPYQRAPSPMADSPRIGEYLRVAHIGHVEADRSQPRIQSGAPLNCSTAEIPEEYQDESEDDDREKLPDPENGAFPEMDTEYSGVEYSGYDCPINGEVNAENLHEDSVYNHLCFHPILDVQPNGLKPRVVSSRRSLPHLRLKRGPIHSLGASITCKDQKFKTHSSPPNRFPAGKVGVGLPLLQGSSDHRPGSTTSQCDRGGQEKDLQRGRGQAGRPRGDWSGLATRWKSLILLEMVAIVLLVLSYGVPLYYMLGGSLQPRCSCKTDDNCSGKNGSDDTPSGTLGGDETIVDHETNRSQSMGGDLGATSSSNLAGPPQWSQWSTWTTCECRRVSRRFRMCQVPKGQSLSTCPDGGNSTDDFFIEDFEGPTDDGHSAARFDVETINCKMIEIIGVQTNCGSTVHRKDDVIFIRSPGYPFSFHAGNCKWVVDSCQENEDLAGVGKSSIVSLKFHSFDLPKYSTLDIQKQTHTTTYKGSSIPATDIFKGLPFALELTSIEHVARTRSAIGFQVEVRLKNG